MNKEKEKNEKPSLKAGGAILSMKGLQKQTASQNFSAAKVDKIEDKVEVPPKKDKKTIEEKNISQVGSSSWDAVINKAVGYKEMQPKTVTIYIDAALKKELDRLKSFESLSNKVNLSSLASAIIDEFIENHIDDIKKLNEESSTRF